MNGKDQERKTPMGSGAASNAMATGVAVSAPPVSTSVMMNYMNNMLTTAKSTLQVQGMGMFYDQNGLPVRIPGVLICLNSLVWTFAFSLDFLITNCSFN